MQSTFNKLRQEAAQWRDDEYRAIRTEFEQACRDIDDLERRFNNGRLQRTQTKKPLVSYVMECMPAGEPITITKLKAIIDQRFPDGQRNYHTVKKCVYRLKDRGTVERTGFNKKGSGVYVLKSAIS